MNNHKIKGFSWDFDGSLPDLIITLEHPDFGVIESPVFPDSEKAGTSFDIRGSSGAFLVKIWDYDDPGREFISGSVIYAPPRANPKIDPGTNIYKQEYATIKLR
jgi:hypothetical protein